MTLTTAAATALALSAIMAGAWFVYDKTRRSGWIDVFWSYAMGLSGVFLALSSPLGHAHAPSARQLLVAILVAIWSIRLGTHVLRRTLETGVEDPRYAIMRAEWKDDFSSRLFWVLQLQALAAFALVASVGVAAHNPAPGVRALDVFGAFVLIGAIYGESVANTQRRQFAADRANGGRICDVGLWAWSRHPDYFFEWLGWLAYPIIAINLSGAYPWGFAALSGPVFMFCLLRYVSGVPPLETHMIRKHGGNFHAYRERVSTFFPWPPRSLRD